MSSKSKFRVISFPLVVCGYIRRECNSPLPLVLTKLCTAYFGNTMIWNFHGKDMDEFLSSINGEVIYSQPFRISNVVFQCSIRPNEWDEIQAGFVGFKLILKKIESGRHMVRSSDPIYSKDIEVKYEVYCHQTDIIGTQLQTWREEGSHIHKRRNFHTLTYYQHPIDFDASASVVASKQFYELTVAEERCRPNGSLCFGCHIEIEQCKKKKRKKKPIEKKPEDDHVKDFIKKE